LLRVFKPFKTGAAGSPKLLSVLLENSLASSTTSHSRSPKISPSHSPVISLPSLSCLLTEIANPNLSPTAAMSSSSSSLGSSKRSLSDAVVPAAKRLRAESSSAPVLFVSTELLGAILEGMGLIISPPLPLAFQPF